MAATALKSFQPCPALVFFDTSTTTSQRRYKRQSVPVVVSNEQHAKRLEEIEHSLWVLCHHFKVFPEDEQTEEKPEEKPPEMLLQLPPVVMPKEQQQELLAIMTALDPVKEMERVVSEALQKDTEQLMASMMVKEPDGVLKKIFDKTRLMQAEKVKAKAASIRYDHTYSSLTEIRTSIVSMSIAEDATSKTTIRDQYGIPWQLLLRKDTDWLILDIDTSGCRHVMGSFKVLVRFLHESFAKSLLQSVSLAVSRIRTVYCGTIGSVTQLREDGYFAADDTLRIRVAVIPMDPDAERSTLEVGQRLKQIPANHNAHKMPKFAEGHLTIPDFLNSRTTVSPTLMDANRATWQLEIRLNQGYDEHQRNHMAVSISQFDSRPTQINPPGVSCHEYFVELLTVNENGWALRQSGRMLDGAIFMTECLLKSRSEIFLKDGKLRLRWGDGNRSYLFRRCCKRSACPRCASACGKA